MGPAQNSNHKLDIEFIADLLTEDPNLILENWVVDLAKKTGLTIGVAAMLLQSVGCSPTSPEPPSREQKQEFVEKAKEYKNEGKESKEIIINSTTKILLVSRNNIDYAIVYLKGKRNKKILTRSIGTYQAKLREITGSRWVGDGTKSGTARIGYSEGWTGIVFRKATGTEEETAEQARGSSSDDSSQGPTGRIEED